MTIKIGSNPSSFLVQRHLGDATTRLSATYERLASGQRINKASDDAAGLAVSSTLNSNARIYGQGIRNINDGVSYLNIADGALEQLSNITIRQSELAEQAANGAYSLTQRRALNTEADKLTEEFNRIVLSTEFNGRKLIDIQQSGGEVRIQAGYGTAGSVSFALGNELDQTVGTGSFSVTQSISTPLGTNKAVAAGDINGDGLSDYITVGWQSGSGALGTAAIYKNNGNGTFTNTGTFRTNLDGGGGDSRTFAVTLADVDSDGSLDVIASGTDQLGGPDTGMTRIFLNNGSGTFSLETTLTSNPSGGAASATTYGLATGDINGDGELDLITGGADDDGDISYSMSRIYLGDGAGNFSLAGVLTSGSASSGSITESIALTDLNNDGALDLVASGKDSVNAGRTRTFLNDGSGNFTQTAILTSNQGSFSSETNSVTIADINRDGYADIIAAGQEDNALGDNRGMIRVFLNQGNGAFSLSSALTSNTDAITGYVNQVVVSDINGDGTADILAEGYQGLNVFLNNGSGGLSYSSSIAAAGDAGLALADFNRDGAIDAVSAAGQHTKILTAVTQQRTTAGYYNLLSSSSARTALDGLRDQLNRISAERGSIGGMQSRLDAALATVSSVRENALAASSRITDVDVAQESAALVSSQILQQSASAILAQANQAPNLALTLLKG